MTHLLMFLAGLWIGGVVGLIYGAAVRLTAGDDEYESEALDG